MKIEFASMIKRRLIFFFSDTPKLEHFETVVLTSVIITNRNGFNFFFPAGILINVKFADASQNFKDFALKPMRTWKMLELINAEEN